MSMIPKKANGFVYFIQDENGLVKIGISKSVTDRMKQLQTGSSQKLVLLGSIGTDKYKRLEKKLHHKYRNSRVNGEWFDITADEVERILNEHKKPKIVSLDNLSDNTEELHNLYQVQFQGMFEIPDERYKRIAVVCYCEYDKNSLYVTEISVGKGAMDHIQYEVSAIPSDWIPLSVNGVFI